MVIRYEIFAYSGAKEAELVFVSVGDSSEVTRDTVLVLCDKLKVGAVVVHLLRPWDSERFVASIPSTGRLIDLIMVLTLGCSSKNYCYGTGIRGSSRCLSCCKNDVSTPHCR